MREILVRNIFVDIFLTYYFKHAFNAALSVLHSRPNNNFIDEGGLSRIFDSINAKIKKINIHNSKNCSFLNVSSLLNLPIKEIYPVSIHLSQEELFWFEFIVNLDVDALFNHFNNSKNIQKVRRLYATPESHKEEFLSIFNNFYAIELVRKRFIQGEKIGNEAHRVGFYIDSKTGVAHRI